MMKTHFGDSYDIVKRTLIAWLRPMGSWAVHPMFTEENASDLAGSFERLVGAPLVSREVLERGTDRDTYFATCAGFGNILLDPNTGLRFPRRAGEQSPDHLFDSDLLSIVRQRSNVLTMIFDQALARGRQIEELGEKLRRLQGKGVQGFAYHSHACFLFIARETEILQRAYSLLSGPGRLPRHRFLAESPTRSRCT